MADKPQFTVTFLPNGQGAAKCEPNPAYPNGKHVDATMAGSNVPTCRFDCPYPATERGAWVGHCHTCHGNFAVTAAGRPDDPLSLTFPCAHKVTLN